MRVSIGVLPTNRTKNNCSMTEEDTVRREGRRSNNFPNRVGWLGYWLRTYSSSAHWDFSCKFSMWATSDRPQASTSKKRHRKWHYMNRSLSVLYRTGINHRTALLYKNAGLHIVSMPASSSFGFDIALISCPCIKGITAGESHKHSRAFRLSNNVICQI